MSKNIIFVAIPYNTYAIFGGWFLSVLSSIEKKKMEIILNNQFDGHINVYTDLFVKPIPNVVDNKIYF